MELDFTAALSSPAPVVKRVAGPRASKYDALDGAIAKLTIGQHIQINVPDVTPGQTVKDGDNERAATWLDNAKTMRSSIKSRVDSVVRPLQMQLNGWEQRHQMDRDWGVYHAANDDGSIDVTKVIVECHENTRTKEDDEAFAERRRKAEETRAANKGKAEATENAVAEAITAAEATPDSGDDFEVI